MSMGNIESYHQIVPEKTLIKVVGKALINKWNKAKDALMDLCEGESEIADALNGDFWGSIDPDSKEWAAFDKASDEITAKFKQETKMDLTPLYTDGDGDCYDDLESNEWYWELSSRDVWVPSKMTTKAAAFVKKYGDSAIDTDNRFSRYG